MAMGRTVSPEVRERYAADEKLAATLSDRLAAAETAGEALRVAQEAHRAPAELIPLDQAYEAALTAALSAAEAAERVAMGPKTYPHGDARQQRAAQIAARQARAKAKVRPFVQEVSRLRTLREAQKLSYRTGWGAAV
jgi:hypothetical protein